MGNLQNELRDVCESVRQQLINLEAIRISLKEVRSKGKVESMLKERLNVYLSTALADLFILSDFLFEAENCNDDGDIELLLEITQDETVN